VSTKGGQGHLTVESVLQAVDALARLSLAGRIRQEGVDRRLRLE
jgi:hypothetical protein